MKMWEPIQALLDDPSDAIRLNALWILGTAVQNNPKAQAAVRPSLYTCYSTLTLYGSSSRPNPFRFCYGSSSQVELRHLRQPDQRPFIACLEP